jgi:AcrR family transcriptional regulator
MKSQVEDRSEPATAAPASARKRELLRIALRQFRLRGYHGTTMNEIGAAAGVSGPALYHHFRNKDDLLVTALLAIARELDAADRATEARRDLAPAAIMRELVRTLVEVALREPDMIVVYLLEARQLPAEVYASLRRVEARRDDRWVHFLMTARPELSPTRARVMVRAVVFMVARACFEDPELDASRLASLLVDMAMRALELPVAMPEAAAAVPKRRAAARRKEKTT